MFKIITEVTCCKECPNLAFEGGMMEHYYCSLTNKEVPYSYLGCVLHSCPLNKEVK